MSVTSRLSIGVGIADGRVDVLRAPPPAHARRTARPSRPAGFERQPVVVVHQPVPVHPGPDLEVRLPGSLGRVLHPLGRARDQPGLRLQPARRVMRVKEVPELIRNPRSASSSPGSDAAADDGARPRSSPRRRRARVPSAGLRAPPPATADGGRPGGLDGLLGGHAGRSASRLSRSSRCPRCRPRRLPPVIAAAVMIGSTSGTLAYSTESRPATRRTYIKRLIRTQYRPFYPSLKPITACSQTPTFWT